VQKTLLFLITIFISIYLFMPKDVYANDVRVSATVLESISIINRNGNIDISTNRKSGYWSIKDDHYLIIVVKI
jgi:hypothetical protein